MILPFELDPQIIHHIIYSQAGSIGKAIIELLMNSVDANATKVILSMSRTGFTCTDNGNGFASREDVIRYFGRFGTPHIEGDATYGRFRLGRGQIMAHAKTVWASHAWTMQVDTRTMGYSYVLTDSKEDVLGCTITGTWYEPLSDEEFMSSVQEIRDLVRYTPIQVNLNDIVITRDPKAETWDFEDEFAYYRAKIEGPVSIYNQGILVRHDSSHVWGAGGLIVTKKAIDLNVSRTEILRKTCPIWKPIAKQFGILAEGIAERMGEHRKTEARRAKSARALLSGDPNMIKLYQSEEVITLLPGKRHITLESLLRMAHFRNHKGKVTIVENAFDVPKGESIAREEIALVVHPQTLDRFGCYNPEDFKDTLERVIDNVRQASREDEYFSGFTWLNVPDFVNFSILKSAFNDRTAIVNEKDILEKETLRAWVALRWCLQNYAGACAGGHRYSNGRLAWDDPNKLAILLGDSTAAEAWTDGKTYLAINLQHVEKLKNDPLTAAAYIFSLVEHEIAHQGDSLDCGHDEAFYQRFHDISIRMSPERQRYMHMWLMKYTSSLEKEGKTKPGKKAWRERYLLDRMGNGRVKKGLPNESSNQSENLMLYAEVPVQDANLIDCINAQLILSGACPPPPNWNEVVERARQEQLRLAEKLRQQANRDRSEIEEFDQWMDQGIQAEREHCAKILGISTEEVPLAMMSYLSFSEGTPDEYVHELWESKPWEFVEGVQNIEMQTEEEEESGNDKWIDDAVQEINNPKTRVNREFWHFIKDGETLWSLERNAAAAGFVNLDDYIQWRE